MGRHPHPVRLYPLVHQIVKSGLGAPLGQPGIVALRTDVIGVAMDFQAEEAVLPQQRSPPVQDASRGSEAWNDDDRDDDFFKK